MPHAKSFNAVTKWFLVSRAYFMLPEKGGNLSSASHMSLLNWRNSERCCAGTFTTVASR